MEEMEAWAQQPGRVTDLTTDTVRVRGMARHTSLEQVLRAFQTGPTPPRGWFSAVQPANEAYLRFRSCDEAALALQRIH
eukprot:2306759-Alexandrium_andersonii.AAC.1